MRITAEDILLLKPCDQDLVKDIFSLFPDGLIVNRAGLEEFKRVKAESHWRSRDASADLADLRCLICPESGGNDICRVGSVVCPFNQETLRTKAGEMRLLRLLRAAIKNARGD